MQLRSETLIAFQRYVRATEARMRRDRERGFLYIDSLPEPKRREIMAEIRQGGIYVASLHTRDDSGRRLNAPHGWIHHWLAVMFIPGATLGGAVAVDQDYNHYKDFYKPDIVRSRILSHTDDRFLVYARLQKKTPWVTITLDTDNDVRYFSDGPGRVTSVSHSTRVMQVENAGEPDERDDLPGQGTGFLWSVEDYWRLEAAPGGLIAEWESIALTRTLPVELVWLIRPFVRRAGEATARDLMIATRRAIVARIAAERRRR